MLAISYFGFDIVPFFWDTQPSLPIAGNSSGWSFWPAKRCYYAARQITPSLARSIYQHQSVSTEKTQILHSNSRFGF